MKICFLGMDNLPVLAEEFKAHGIGGEQVQQTLLARSLTAMGHEVRMVVYDYGQADRQEWDGIVTHRAYRPADGIPVVRFIHPRWIKTWHALRAADADIYYVSCAGMQLGLAAMFCKLYRRKLVFRVAHDTDCRPNALLIKYWRDKKLYEYGLRHADLILVQSYQQQLEMLRNYARRSMVAKMLVQPPGAQVSRDIDVLWVNNLRHFKRPDLLLQLAQRMPHLSFCMIGGRQENFSDLYDEICDLARGVPNLQFMGRVPYQEMSSFYGRARVFVNTSDSEGFPNSYLQAWVHGTPTVAFFDPDSIIRKERLGYAVDSLDEMCEKVGILVANKALLDEYSTNCRNYMNSAYADNTVLATYLNGMREVCRG